ncbi:MAG TPA: multicopper oxidase domain-containing protein [Candidatus Sulfotelmatobacter sp.]|nr:multicopper oxidase domain-containing protein [Candidatus Sulfotelmatobacter sp.]
MRKPYQVWMPILLVAFQTVAASAQSFRVQCPTNTITHPDTTPAQLVNSAEPAYSGPTSLLMGPSGFLIPDPAAKNANGAIKCQQISGGDGYSTMGDGTQTYMFSFGPLSGLADIAKGLPGTQFPSVFNTVPTRTLSPGDPATTDGPFTSSSFPLDPSTFTFSYNGAVGLAKDVPNLVTIYDIVEIGNTVYVQTNAPLGLKNGDPVVISGTGLAYDGTRMVATANYTFPTAGVPGVTNYGFAAVNNFTFTLSTASNLADVNTSQTATAAIPAGYDGHVDPRPIMDVGVMNGNIPAPLMAIDEDDEFFLTLTNVGMIMRPDLFEQHTVHFHGYPNASSFYDGVPDASVAINIGASFTYYYLAPDAGTYFWHCHITPPEHLQMGMVGQLYVRPRQNRVPTTMTLYQGLSAQQTDLRTKCDSTTDILCSNPLPIGGDNSVAGGFTATGPTKMFAYNDGDGSTQYDVEYPIQIHGFDPNFHFVGMTFNPEGFSDMKDKYFLLNGRSYPDTVTVGPLATVSTDGSQHFSQPLSAIINIPAGKRALLRISDLDVTEYQTLASLGIPMQVVGYNAKLLRDQAGNNLYYTTNSITLGGGESLDVILDATGYTAGQVFYLYTPNLDHLSNDAENFGGLMTEVRIN